MNGLGFPSRRTDSRYSVPVPLPVPVPTGVQQESRSSLHNTDVSVPRVVCTRLTYVLISRELVSEKEEEGEEEWVHQDPVGRLGKPPVSYLWDYHYD